MSAHLADLPVPALLQTLEVAGVGAAHARRVAVRIHRRGARTWDGLGLGRAKLAALRARFRFGPRLATHAVEEAADGTRKFVFRLADGVRNRDRADPRLPARVPRAVGHVPVRRAARRQHGRRHVDALGRELAGLRSILNVIPWNDAGGGFRAPSWAEVKDFTTRLRRLRCPVKIRSSEGKRDGMGCGQLSSGAVPVRATEGHLAAPPGIFTGSI